MNIAVVLDETSAETGLWCDECALPSVVRVDVSLMTNLTVGTPIPASWCLHHEGLDDESGVDLNG